MQSLQSHFLDFRVFNGQIFSSLCVVTNPRQTGLGWVGDLHALKISDFTEYRSKFG